MKIICDTHVHSSNSFDGESTVREICESAIEKGISSVTITDHMEAPEISLGDKSIFGNAVKSITQSVKDVEELSEEYEGRVSLLKGMELGEPLHKPSLTKKAYEIADFDFILASIHNVLNEEDFYYLTYTRENVPSLLERYFNELLDTAQNADFDSLAHLTYPMRYIIERTDIRPDLDKYSEIIDEIFLTLVKRNKALEINTSGLFKPIGTTLPDLDLVRRFRELGGSLVTIGSDAHNCKKLGAGVVEGIEIARLCGFKSYTVYQNRSPKQVAIWY
ncbi:MAG: histidinol-phosphatase HisJ family protein [Ruminococcus sp.]|nr:histidinol-phosphatase HisJ family protein [Ruminococcus sp.]